MNIPLDKFVNWLKNKNLKDRTIENYVYYYNKFTFESFNQESVSRFLANKTNMNSIARSFLVNLQKFIKINWQELGLSQELRSKAVDVEFPKLTGTTKKRIITPIPHDIIPKIEEALQEESDKIKLLLSYYGALRLGGLLKIRITDFNWSSWKNTPEGMGECRVFEKGDKEGIALFPSFIMKRLAKFIRGNNFSSANSRLFIKEGEVNIKNLGRTWQMRLKQAGIDCGYTKVDDNGKTLGSTGVHPHKLRHSYASYLLNERGLDIREIQEFLRHTSIQSTQIYTHINKEQLKRRLNNDGKNDGRHKANSR